jgi:hypothetical protein
MWETEHSYFQITIAVNCWHGKIGGVPKHRGPMKSASKVAVGLSSSKRLAWLLPILFSAALAAQQAAPSQNNSQLTSDACLQRSIPLTILRLPQDRKLEAKGLQLFVDGNPTSIFSLRQEDIAPRVVMLVDTSGSMFDEEHSPAWELGYLASELALETTAPDSPIALVAFDNQVDVSRFQGRNAVSEHLKSMREIRPRGQTALYDAVEKSIEIFGPPQFGDTIYIVSDGADNSSKLGPKVVEGSLIQQGIRVFAFIVNDVHKKRHTPEDRSGPINLAGLAHSTGGNSTVLPMSEAWAKSADAAKAARMIAAQVRVPFRLDLQLRDPVIKPVKLKITTSSKDVAFSYPEHIEPCAAPVANPP